MRGWAESLGAKAFLESSIADAGLMRILLCGINYASDLIGMAKYNTELCETSSANGHDVRVITAPPYYPEWKSPMAYRSWRYSSEDKGWHIGETRTDLRSKQAVRPETPHPSSVVCADERLTGHLGCAALVFPHLFFCGPVASVVSRCGADGPPDQSLFVPSSSGLRGRCGLRPRPPA